MADNAGYTEGSGVIIAADEVGGVLHQRVKLSLGADGSATDVPIGQQVSGLSIPVVLPAAQITTLTPPAAITGFSTEATLSSLNAKVTAVNTGAVVVSSSALPSGASTSANQTTIIGHVDGIETALTTLNAKDFATQTTLAALNTKVTAVNTGAVVVSSSALPTGAATEATLSTLNSKVTACNTGAVVVSSSALPTGAATEATLATASSLLDSATNMLVSIEGFQTGISNDLSILSTTVGDIVTGAGFASETTLASALKAEDAVAASGDKGIMALAVRADTAAATGANGDYVPLLVDSTGRLHCNVSSTVSTSSVCNVTQVASTAVLTGNGASGTGALRVTIANDSTANIATIGTSVTPGTAAANLGKAEDAVAASGDTGIAAWGVRRDTPVTSVSAAGDYAEFGISGQGAAWTSLTPSVGGGWTPYKLLSAASTNATSLKASAGTLGSFYLFNTTTSPKFVKLYNKASAPTVGTDTPVHVIPVPAESGATHEWAHGLKFSTGIAFAITGAVADSDTTAIGANEVIVNLGWL